MAYDLRCAQNCWNSYNANSEFSYIFFSGDTDDVWCGVKFYDDCIIVTFRGSTTVHDWWRDFTAFPFNDPDLGWVHKGFMEGLRTTYAFLYNLAQKNPGHLPIIVTGHSLGAARALLFGGLLTVYNIPCEIIAFGAPIPGCSKLKDILKDIPITLYKNRKDLVTDVPFWLPSFPVVRPRDHVEIDVPPPDNDGWGILADHHSELYLQGIKNKFAQ